MRTRTHFPMSSHTQGKCSAVAKAGHSAVLSPLVALQDAGSQTQEKNRACCLLGGGGVDLTSAVHYSMAVLVPFRSGCLSRGFLISNLFVSQEVQMNVGLAEGLQDTSDFDMGSQSNPIRDTHMVAAKPLRELCAGSPAPCQALPAGRWSGSSLGAAGSALDRPR